MVSTETFAVRSLSIAVPGSSGSRTLVSHPRSLRGSARRSAWLWGPPKTGWCSTKRKRIYDVRERIRPNIDCSCGKGGNGKADTYTVPRPYSRPFPRHLTSLDDLLKAHDTCSEEARTERLRVAQ